METDVPGALSSDVSDSGVVCGYTFNLTLDSKGTTISWTMHDEYETALANVREVVGNANTHMAAKTTRMNYLLNEVTSAAHTHHSPVPILIHVPVHAVTSAAHTRSSVSILIRIPVPCRLSS